LIPISIVRFILSTVLILFFLIINVIMFIGH
jgi:hypothetical protein